MQAKFYDGRTAERYSVQIDVLSDRVAFRLTDKPTSYDWFFRDLDAEKLSDSIVILRNRLIPDARLEVEGNQIAQLFESKLKFRPSVMLGHDTKVLVTIVAVFALCVGGLFFLLDELADELVMHIPRQMEKRAFGEFEKVVAKMECQAPEAKEVVDQLTKRLTTPEEYKDFRVLLVGDSTVNAFALPGGTIIIHSALIKQIHHSDELAGVIAHEIEHQAQRHIARSLIKRSIVSLLGGVLIGGTAGDVASSLTNLSFSRDFELAADHGAAERLDKAGISRMGMVNFLKRLNKMAVLPQFLSTHPMEGREQQLLENYEVPKGSAPSLSDSDFKKLKALKCVTPK